MFYHPSAHTAGFGDIVAAWLVCLVVATAGFAYSATRTQPQDAAASYSAPAASPAAPGIAICAARGSRPA
jgi:hypothetical protein